MSLCTSTIIINHGQLIVSRDVACTFFGQSAVSLVRMISSLG